MRIKRLSWRNYKGLVDGQIAACGSDVIISGRNGAGKSTIAQMLSFVLSGKVAGSLKRYESGLKVRDGLIHGAKIEFEDGTVLSRSIVDASNGGTKSILGINGASVTARKYEAFVENLTHGGGELILNPFAFVSMASRQQRDLLLKMFEASGGGEIPSTPEEFGGKTAESFIAQCRAELRSPKAEAQGIPARIDELERQVARISDLPAMETLTAELTAKKLELETITRIEMPARTEYESAKMHVDELNREKSFLERQLELERSAREKYLSEYRKVRGSSAGTCPTCGQTIPLELFEAKRDERLFEIVAAGKTSAARLAELEKSLSATEAELTAAIAQLEKLKARVEAEESERTRKIERSRELAAEISTLQMRLSELNSAAKNLERIGELKRREKELNAQIVKLEGQIATAEAYQQERIVALEAAINAQFKHVRFKLFDTLIDGTPRETCEAMLHGIPYGSLSKGEKLLAAMDIFKAIQKYYGVEMPLILDDAESYTLNSFVELPNQKFIFRVTEGELSVEIMESRRAA